MLSIIRRRRLWFTISGVAVVASLVLISTIGLRFGIDFTGGALLEARFSGTAPSSEQIEKIVVPLSLRSLRVQSTADGTVILRFRAETDGGEKAVFPALQKAFPGTTQERFDSIGPTIGKELRTKAAWATGIVLIAIVLYIAYTFRRVSAPVASWKYGVIAIIALLHDVTIMTGAFVLFGHFFGAEAGSLFIVAVLTVLGYSVNDTIVVFDRIRENLLQRGHARFADVVEMSIAQTIGRSLNTSLTTLFVLAALLLFGGSTLRDFVGALFVGIFVGTYSSIFVASPLLVTWEAWRHRRTP